MAEAEGLTPAEAAYARQLLRTNQGQASTVLDAYTGGSGHTETAATVASLRRHARPFAVVAAAIEAAGDLVEQTPGTVTVNRRTPSGMPVSTRAFS